MRGIEGALEVLNEVERGMFAAEALRRVWGEVVPTERKLTSTLVYITLRRLGLWKHILEKYCKRPPGSLHKETVSVLLPGIAGVLELKHFKPGVLVNALVQRVKHIRDESGTPREAALVNAVLHTVMEHAPRYIETLREAPAIRDQALAHGVPGWVAAEWSKEWGVKEAKQIIRMSTAQTYLSLRMSPNVDREAWLARYGEPASPSGFLPNAVCIESNPYPPELPGYAEGLVTPQSESSIWAVENLMSYWSGGSLLDMCMGRGVKSGQILAACPDARIEGWDLSGARLQAARREFARLGLDGAVRTVCGDALALVPESPPSAVLLDAPCSGSGTWGRHPEGKWRTSPGSVKKLASLQRELFSKAAELLAPGGVLMYCTCSVFREENENVVGSVLASRSDLIELPPKLRMPGQRKGKPYGTLALPESPWIDGFYIAIFRKKG